MRGVKGVARRAFVRPSRGLAKRELQAVARMDGGGEG